MSWLFSRTSTAIVEKVQAEITDSNDIDLMKKAISSHYEKSDEIDKIAPMVEKILQNKSPIVKVVNGESKELT